VGSGRSGNMVSVCVLARDEEVTQPTGLVSPYVQRGEGKEARRSSLPKGWSAATIDLERALSLLALPRDVGAHPETGKMISAGLGRYGPFVLHDGTYAKIGRASCRERGDIWVA